MTVVVLSSQARQDEVDGTINRLRSLGLTVQVSQGAERTILLVLDGTAEAIGHALGGTEVVERIQTLARPYHLAAREVRPEGTLVSIGSLLVGAGRPLVIAGPASPFTPAGSDHFARELRSAGVDILRCSVYRAPGLLYG
ncbi:MAG: hypothetical protein ACR2PL_09515, partial [Dehalococcoidia bacterium]